MPRAAELLALSMRQVKRLKKRLRGAGEAAMAHANRGRPTLPAGSKIETNRPAIPVGSNVAPGLLRRRLRPEALSSSPVRHLRAPRHQFA